MKKIEEWHIDWVIYNYFHNSRKFSSNLLPWEIALINSCAILQLDFYNIYF